MEATSTTGGKADSISLPRLAGLDTWTQWIDGIEDAVEIRGWEYLLMAPAAQRALPKDDAAAIRNAAVLRSAIRRSMAADNYLYIEGLKDPYDCLQALKRVYECNNDAMAGHLWSQFTNYRLPDGASVEDAYSTLRKIAMRLALLSHDERVPDTLFKRRLIDSLPARYNQTVEALKVSGTRSTTAEEILNLLKNSKGEEGVATVEAAQDKDYAQWTKDTLSGSNYRRGSGLHRNTGNARSTQERSNVQGRNSARGRSSAKGKGPQCWKCNQYGHIQRDCPKNAAEGRAYASAEVPDYAWTVRLAGEAVSCSRWQLDSGCTAHMTPSRDAFTDYRPYTRDVVVASGEALKAVGKGTVCLNHGDAKIVLREALHVPGLSTNLVSIHQLTERGFKFEFGAAEAIARRNGQVMARIPKIGKEYALG